MPHIGSKLNVHDCDLDYDSDEDVFPPPPAGSTCWTSLGRCLKRSILISLENPSCQHYLRSTHEVRILRKKQYQSGKWTVHPFSKFRVYYEMYMSVVYFVCHCYYPFSVAFTTQHRYVFLFLNNFFNIFYALDLLVRLFSGYWDKKANEIVMDRGMIIKRAFCSFRFYMDLVSCIPTLPSVTGNVTVSQYLHCLTLLKLNRVTANFKYCRRSVQYLGWKGDVFDLCTLTVFVLLLLHFSTCLMFMIPHIRKLSVGISPRSWVVLHHILNESVTTQYVRAMYRAFSYIFTIRIDFFDRPPWAEAVAAIIIYSFGKVFILSVTVIISHIVISRNSLEVKYYRIISQVECFINKKELPANLRKRILDNYFYKYHGTFCKESRIYELLSEKLRREITGEVLGRLSTTVNLFRLLTPQFLESVLVHLKTEIYMTNDIIIKSGSSGDCMYFLASGTVCIYTPSGKEVCHLEDGDYFGEVAILFKDRPRSATVIALETCEVYKMSKRGFYACFRKKPDILKMLRDAATSRKEVTEIYEDIHMRSKHVKAKSSVV